MPWVAAIALTAASTAMQMKASREEGKAAEDIAEANAAAMEAEAEAAEEASHIEQSRLLEQGKAVKARQRALYAGAGVGLEGTPTEFAAGTAGEIEFDRQLLRMTGQREASRYRRQAQIDILSGKQARRLSRFKQTAQLMQGVGKGFSIYGRKEGWEGF